MMYTGFDSFRVNNPIIYKRHLPESFSIIFHTSEPEQNDGYNRIIEASYKGFTQGIVCENLSDGDEIIFDDFFTMIDWTGVDGSLRIVSTDSNHNLHCDTNFTVQEIRGTLRESAESVGKKLAQLLTEKGIASTYDEGFTTLINKVSQIELSEYQPNLRTSPCQTIASGYTFSVNNGIAGGYSQCGYVSDGFYNSTKDWVLSLTLHTSKWDGGFCLFAYPYPLQTCSEYNNSKWDCIMKNGQSDILLFLDGQLQQNISVGSLDWVGIPYTKNATIDIKFVKKGTDFYYYEDDNFKGKFVWNKLSTAKRLYLGTLTWGNSGSTNTFSNVLVERNAIYFADKCNKAPNNANYGRAFSFDGLPNAGGAISYDSTHGCYQLNHVGAVSGGETMFYPIPYLTGAKNLVIEADIASQHILDNSIGIGFVDKGYNIAFVSLEHNQALSNWRWVDGNISSFSVISEDPQSFTDTWYHTKIIVNENDYLCYICENNTKIASVYETFVLDIPTRKVGIVTVCPDANSNSCFIKNIKVTGTL